MDLDISDTVEMLVDRNQSVGDCLTCVLNRLQVHGKTPDTGILSHLCVETPDYRPGMMLDTGIMSHLFVKQTPNSR